MQITFRVLISELKELTQLPSLSWTLSHSHFWGYLVILWSIGSSTRVEAMDEEAPLVDDKPVEIPKKNHARDVHILSSAFLLVFLAYGAVQNLESTLNTVSLLSLFFAFAFFCFPMLGCWELFHLLRELKVLNIENLFLFGMFYILAGFDGLGMNFNFQIRKRIWVRLRLGYCMYLSHFSP